MPKPVNKDELLEEVHREWIKLEEFLKTLSADEMVEPGIVGEWSVKDVLAHIHEWAQMYCGWCEAGLRHEVPAIPAPGYTWRETPQLNHQIYLCYREDDLNDVLQRFRAMHQTLVDSITSASEDELFKPGYHSWTRKNALIAYLVPATSGHYRWAYREMRRSFKAKQTNKS